jgi:glycosyltransferase involved in cell wall biosynthesis
MYQRSVHFWFPNIFEFKGGIQTYCAFLLEAFSNIWPDIHCEVFLKQDKVSSPDSNKLDTINFHCSGNIPTSIRTPAFAAQIINRGIWQRPNLVICGHTNFAIAAYLLKRLTGIPYWIFVYGLEAWDIDSSISVKALQNADRIISIGGYTRDRMLEAQNLDPNKFSLLPCTFKSGDYQIASKPQYLLDKYKLTPQQPIILTVARLAEVERYKGYDRILEALPQIRKSIPDIHYILVGKGNDRSRIEQLIAKLNLQDCVTLAGFVPDEQLCDYYNLCDVFAMPSKREGFGIVYLEAMACGKPCLGGNRDGAIDALCHGELGALVNPDDVDAIAQTLIQILQGTYPNPLMYQPELLRAKVIEIYGFDRFQQTLGDLLADWQQKRLER